MWQVLRNLGECEATSAGDRWVWEKEARRIAHTWTQLMASLNDGAAQERHNHA